MVILFALTISTSAFLLFLVQPMFANIALPLLGGAPAVWTTCMVFFQATLLIGYAYAHAVMTWLATPRQVFLHASVLLLPLLALPIRIAPAVHPAGNTAPIPWLLGLMLFSVGLPFFAVSATAPLLQRWFSNTDHALARDPYFLYAGSNAGSLLALLSYPLLVQPWLSVRRQSLLWAFGYVLFICLMLACGIVTWRKGLPRTGRDEGADLLLETPAPPSPRLFQKLEWLALSFVPSSLMLAVTAYLSTDIATVPLLWVLPMSLYLLTFIMAFGSNAARMRAIARRAVPLVVLPLVVFMAARLTGSLWYIVIQHLAAFFAIALGCHARLAEDRPSPKHLTGFYLWMAAGGMMGGVFNSIIAPALFTGISEYPAIVTLGCLLLASRTELVQVIRTPTLLIRPAVAGVLAATALILHAQFLRDIPIPLVMAPAILVCFTASRQPVRLAFGVALILLAGFLVRNDAGQLLYAQRTFYGVYRVTVDRDRQLHSLFHGTTLHGTQSLDRASRMKPLTYYHPDGPIGQVFALRQKDPHMSVAVVGLGTGSLAGYARAGERWRFYEIDPAVERIARDPRFFSYLTACPAVCDVVLGDARLSLARERGTHYDLIILDAFSSDAIPVHLLTREALAIYIARLAPGGLLAFHISNQHLSLRRVVGDLAHDFGMVALDRVHDVTSNTPTDPASSEWVVLSRQADDVQGLVGDPRWSPASAGHGARVWTDDFSNIISVLRWR